VAIKSLEAEKVIEVTTELVLKQSIKEAEARSNKQTYPSRELEISHKPSLLKL